MYKVINETHIQKMPEMEEWRDIPGYEGIYQVSSIGRVKSLPKMVGHNWGGLKKWPEKIFKGWLSAYGYPEVNLKNNGEALHLKVHRLVALAFIANPDNKPWVNHKNGIKTDNRVENLEWCTPDENNKHASKTGLFNSFSGTNSALAKVTSEQVLEIRRLRSETKITYEELGKRFGLSGVACLHICKRKTWKHI